LLKNLKPYQILLAGYIGVIILGALLLLLPWTRRGDLSLTDAFFTSTSAVCVTGLIVKDTQGFFTPVGKGIILLLLQIGGIGYMTLATFFLFLLGAKSSFSFRMTMSQSFPELSIGNIFRFAKLVILVTLALEITGTLILYLSFLKYGFSNFKAFGHALFTSVSAFCNAGFSTFATSLTRYRGDIIINLTVMFLIVIGGIGFVLLQDMEEKFLLKTKKKLTLHSKAVLIFTVLLIITGALIIFVSEYSHGFAGFSLKEKILVSLFQAITARTAGFSTVNMNILSPSTLYFIMLFMFIGGSPGGTAGGIKTTTFFGTFIWLYNYLKGNEQIVFLKYRISEDTIKKIFSIFLLSVAIIFTSTFLVMVLERDAVKAHGLLPYLFEVFSAFGTVGLSWGSFQHKFVSLSADFNIPAKWVIILTMLAGKVGVLSLASLIVEKKKEEIGYVPGKYVVG